MKMKSAFCALQRRHLWFSPLSSPSNSLPSPITWFPNGTYCVLSISRCKYTMYILLFVVMKNKCWSSEFSLHAQEEGVSAVNVRKDEKEKRKIQGQQGIMICYFEKVESVSVVPPHPLIHYIKTMYDLNTNIILCFVGFVELVRYTGTVDIIFKFGMLLLMCN